METRLRIPKNWQDFEMLCHKLWRDFWNDPNAQRNGRAGQPQAGVDVWGKPAYLDFYAGVQCKDKDSRLGSILSTGDIDSECRKAVTFEPPIEEFTIATTACRDAEIQAYTRNLNNERRFPFQVYVWAWEDIEEEIRCRPMLIDTFFEGVQLISSDSDQLTMSFVYQKQQSYAFFFSRPGIQRRLPSGLREMLIPLVYELSDNAFRHGKATHFHLICQDTAIHLEDNGTPFNPLEELDSRRVSAQHHIGSLILDRFRQEFMTVLTVGYRRTSLKGADWNRLTLTFSQPTWTLGQRTRIEIPVNISTVTDRESGRRLASSVSLPDDAANVIVSVEGMSSVSSLTEFIVSLGERLGGRAHLTVYAPLPEPYLVDLRKFFSADRVSLRPRV
jgi:hypothetical protein